jgi:arsenite/tail-anchored protein-transporting ATPase
MRPFDHRLVMVLGKGGVGRTTVTAGLARAAARLGRRTCAADLGGTDALAVRLGLVGRSYQFRRVIGGLDVWSATPAECFDDFLARKIHLPGLARKVVHNRFVDTFIDAVPGLNDMMMLGRVENLLVEPGSDEPQYDFMVIDAPATGHGLTLLQAARTMTDMTKVGPFHDLSRAVDIFLSDPHRTAVVLVTLPEELPVSETLELAADLGQEGFRVHTVIANLVEREPIPDPPGVAKVSEVLSSVTDGAALAGLVADVSARAARHASALAELEGGLRRLGIAAPVAVGRAPSIERLGATLVELL